jgi:hypothetical protein
MRRDIGDLMRDFIDSQIASRQSRIGELQRQLEALENEMHAVQGELRAYGEMRDHLPDSPHNAKAIDANPAKPVERPSTIPSEMTPGWRKVLCKVGEGGRTFDAADIVQAATEIGVPAQMTNARSQIYQWQKKRVIARVRKGKYRLAPKGQDAIRKAEGSGAGAPEPS